MIVTNFMIKTSNYLYFPNETSTLYERVNNLEFGGGKNYIVLFEDENKRRQSFSIDLEEVIC